MKIDNRIFGILTALVVAALFAGGWFLGASPLIDQMNTADAARADVVTRNQQLEAELAALAKAKEQLPEMIEAAELLTVSIPGDTDSSIFIRGLNGLAAASGVTITIIEMLDGQPYQAPAVGDPMPHTDPLITAENFVVVPIAITIEGPWPNVLDFIDRLQHGQRLALVTDIKATRDAGESFTVILGGTIYVLPDGDSELDETQTDDDEEPEPTPEPSATPEPSVTPDPSVTPSPSETPAA
jgi:hypothetical protein